VKLKPTAQSKWPKKKVQKGPGEEGPKGPGKVYINNKKDFKKANFFKHILFINLPKPSRRGALML
jgi:hypothetical protein